ncbi:LuxR C-terminal-related transcriptional regulator [Actinoplanes sp. CA-030573]|uniref:LuxR C-terminal-related transcriptional regulator n=1 Tax=Actinoplanes sp. CA-030573 TaxID=3239898 RepID=UPI003D8C6850
MDGAPPRPAVTLRSAKLEPPTDRPGTVVRTALIDRATALAGVPVLAVVAPPGYGKTTFLAQWAERRGPRVAWMTCDATDNDPAVLLTGIAAALGRVEPAARAAFPTPAPPAMGVADMTAFTAALGSLSPVLLVIDSVEALTSVECRRLLTELALRLPPGWQLALASRHVLPLPVGRLRARHEIAEIGRHELAMDPGEAAMLIAAAQVDLTAAEVDDLVARTEGWPAGLYLAALSIRAGTPHCEAGFAEARDESYMTGYLRAELLDRASPAEVTFLTRTSVLDRMSGPLCDMALGTAGSARALKDLAGRNLLVIPLDHREGWYRYHHVLRRLLRAELQRREPGTVRTLIVRASEWCQENDQPEAAIRYAQEIADADRVARLVLGAAQPNWASGRITTVLAWMEWLERHGAVERYPAIAVHGALILALLGRAVEAERWAGIAERGRSAGALADGSTEHGVRAYLRAMSGRDGVEAMRRDATESWAGLSPSSPYRPTAMFYLAISHLLEDDPDQADPILANAVDDALRAGSPPLAALALAERCIAAGPGGRAEADEMIGRALAIVEDGHLEDYWTSALVFAVAARITASRGDVTAARRHLVRVARLRPLLTYALPVVSVQALLQMAHGYVALADTGGAAAVLDQARAIRTRRPDLGNLGREADELTSRVRRLSAIDGGASSLTAAELRLLPLLSTHLSLGEIAQQLHVSRDTVKTQAASIYRKLGASGRRSAVVRSGELGTRPVRM